MPRIVTVTVNPALDKSYTVPHFAPGGVFRPSRSRTTPGGKGINVARVLKTLGADVVATGCIGGANGDEILRGLEEEGIVHDFVHLEAGNTRQAILILDPKTHEQTVINEIGPAALEDMFEQLQAKLAELLIGADYVVFSGSLAPEMACDCYRKLISQAKSLDVSALIDTSGDALKSGVSAEPSIVKVNAEEAEALGVEIEQWERDAAAGARQMQEKYKTDYAVITGGSKGAVAAGKSGCFLAKSPVLEVVSAVGSGDSFAAGLVFSLSKDSSDLENALYLAAACGAANTLSEGAGFCKLGQINEILGKINIDMLG